MKPLINQPHTCIVCRRRDGGLGVGKHNAIGWYCAVCGPDRAKVMYHMPPNDLDAFERRALETIRAQMQDGDLDVPETEIIPFLEWLIQAYGEAIRKDIDNGGAPF